jgi:hypothetical protein
MSVRRRLRTALPLLLLLTVVAAGCGGKGSASGGYTYIVEAPPKNGVQTKIYFTLISPVPLPRKLFTGKRGRIVRHAQGPQVCSATKTVHGGHGPAAFLNGKQVTVKVNGSNHFLPAICSILKEGTFDLSPVG